MKLTSWSLHCVKSLFDTSAKLLGSFWANIHLHLCAAAVPVPAGFTSKAGESVKAWHLLESACPKVAKQANYVLTLHSRKDLNWPFVAAVPIRWDPSHKLDVSMCFCDYVVAVPWKKKISLLRMLPPQNEMWWRTFVNVLKPAMIKGNMACSHTATVTEHTQRCESEDTEQEVQQGRETFDWLSWVRSKNVSLRLMEGGSVGRRVEQVNHHSPSALFAKMGLLSVIINFTFKILFSCRSIDIPDWTPGPGVKCVSRTFWDA